MGNKNAKYDTYKDDDDDEWYMTGCDALIVDSSDQPDSPDDVGRIVRSYRSQLSNSPNDIDQAAAKINHRDYVYPFENLVFEGGGNKGLAYCGALKEIEDMGMMPQIRRFAGTSAGAMTAALLSVGYSADDILGFLSQDLSKIFVDHSCGYCSLIPNLLRSYGWNPGRKIFHWFAERMYQQTDDRDITFRQVYERYGKELCVVVTNLNQMSILYCHVKTTPDMPVIVAIRMSIAIPGLFSATKYKMTGYRDIYVDGGVLCNYPIHAFDGWWLSLDHEDNFFKKLQPMSKLNQLCRKQNRFGEWNEKTLGFLLYSDREYEVFRDELEARRGVELPPYPDTHLSRLHKSKKKEEDELLNRSIKVRVAVDNFVKVLDESDRDKSSSISFEEFQTAFENPTFSQLDREVLFWKDVSASQAFDMIRKKTRDTICYDDVLNYLEITGFRVTSKFVGCRRREIQNFAGFLDALQTCLTTNAQRIYIEEKDIARSVGINTGYLETTDFTLEKSDREYLFTQGSRSLIIFLKYYVALNNPPMRNSTDDTVSPLSPIVEGTSTSPDQSIEERLQETSSALPSLVEEDIAHPSLVRLQEDIAHPSLVQEDIAHPSLVQENISHPSLVQEDISHPSLVQKDIAHPSLVQEDIAHPSLVQEDIAHPSLVQEDIAHPSLVQEDIAHPSLVQEDIVHPSLIQEDIAHPSLVQEDIAHPSLEQEEIAMEDNCSALSPLLEQNDALKNLPKIETTEESK